MKLRNNTAAFGWAISLAFLAACLAFTWLLIRDGASDIPIYPPDIPEVYPAWVMPAVLALFWMVGLTVTIHVAHVPCVLVEVMPDKSVRVVRRYLHRREVTVMSRGEFDNAQVIESKDSEGDPYFCVQLADASGALITITESSSRPYCEEICARFNRAINSFKACGHKAPELQ